MNTNHTPTPIQYSLFEVFGLPEQAAIQNKQLFDTTLFEARTFLLSLIPANAKDNDLLAVIKEKQGKKSFLCFIEDTKMARQRFFKKAEKNSYYEAEILGEIRRFREEKYSYVDNAMAARYLEEWGYKVDMKDHPNFTPDLKVGAYFAFYNPFAWKNPDEVGHKANEEIDIDFKKNDWQGWQVFQYMGVANALRGTEYAELRFSNEHFLEQKEAADYFSYMTYNDRFKAMMKLGYIKEVGEEVAEAYKAFKKYRFLAEYQINKIDTVITLFAHGNTFFCKASNNKLEHIIHRSFSAICNEKEFSDLAAQILDYYENITLVKGEDVLGIADMKQRNSNLISKAIALLPKHIRDIVELNQKRFVDLVFYCKDTPEILAENLEKNISGLVTQAEEALKSPVRAQAYIDNVLIHHHNYCSRLVFGVVANVSVSNLHNANKAYREKWFEVFLTERFGENALREIEAAKQEAEREKIEQEKTQEIPKAIQRVKDCYHCLKSWYQEILADLTFSEKIRDTGKVKTWYYGDDKGTYVVAKRNDSYKDFYKFITEAIKTYGSVHRALVALGVKSRDEVDMAKLSNTSPLVMDF